jgi:hypothetical protein
MADQHSPVSAGKIAGHRHCSDNRRLMQRPQPSILSHFW